uniref:Uncharacterized protein n=1 Tax=Hippocampus comes TaxID=109280 RepID=A0A3Q3DVS3_HIPCM
LELSTEWSTAVMRVIQLDVLSICICCASIMSSDPFSRPLYRGGFFPVDIRPRLPQQRREELPVTWDVSFSASFFFPHRIHRTK